ncbi:MAG: HAD family phosphatase [Melioribacteraceae bacterium]|jgi:putative hydrolase of the HAD superfamily|nr:HAD family phosphatase [Melioribacteraceae bacterium]
MHNYSVIVFDLGNVLIPFDYSPTKEFLNNKKEGLGDIFFQTYKNNYNIHQDFEKGLLSSEEFLSIMMKWTENKVTGKEFCEVFSNIFTKNDDVIALLPILKQEYKLVLLSNTNEIHKEYGYGNYDFLTHFDKLILSHEVGAIKPEKEIYHAVEKYTQKPASEHLFIDDVKEYAEGAINCGWDAINFIGYENLVNDLKKRNII